MDYITITITIIITITITITIIITIIIIIIMDNWDFEEDPEKIKQFEIQKNNSSYRDYIKKYVNTNSYIILSNFDGKIINMMRYINTVNELCDSRLTNMIINLYPNHFNMISETKIEFKIPIITGITLTDDQQTVFGKIIDFMMDHNKKTYGLFGFSGTGKTTTFIEIIACFLKNKLINSVIFTAPTNTAVKVIKNKFCKYVTDIHNTITQNQSMITIDDALNKLHSIGITIEFSTIHRLLNIELSFDKDGNKIQKKNKNINFLKYSLIIIDECSMLSTELVESVLTDIRKSSTVKVIFSGDMAQLPPVKEINSIIFAKSHDDFPLKSFLKYNNVIKHNSTHDKLHDKSHDKLHDGSDKIIGDIIVEQYEEKYEKLMDDIIGMEYFVMENIVRSKSNNVLGVCNKIRKWALCESKNGNFGKYVNKTKDCVAYKHENTIDKICSKWFEIMLEYIINGIDSIIITWTNKQCNIYNTEIRKKLFGTGVLDRFLIGDVLVMNETCIFNETDRLSTSEKIIVKNVSTTLYPMNKFSKTISKKAQNLSNSKSYIKKYDEFIESIESTNGAGSINKTCKCWKLTVEYITNSNPAYTDIYVIHEDNFDEFEQNKNNISNMIKNLRKKLITNHGNKTEQIDTTIIEPLWMEYYNIYEQSFANVTYGYSMTCHKAQGSTFYNVFVDMDDIGYNTNTNEMRRCAYTAISRTSNELHMLI